jgi:hypothetical protein
MGKPLRLNRRAFLGGAAGTTIALPMLEIMTPSSAHAAPAPMRHVTVFGGIELNFANSSVPTSTGSGYAMPPAWASLESVREHVSLVSGLSCAPSADPPAPGGLPTGGFHNRSLGPLLAGKREYDGKPPPGPTSDRIVAEALGDTQFKTLDYRAQPESYGGGVGRMSVEASGKAVDPIASPMLAYSQLFAGFVPADPKDAALKEQLLLRDKSVLDLVIDRSDRLMTRLGSADKARLERHLDEIRELEKRLMTIPGGGSPTGSCDILPDPGADPASQQLLGQTGGNMGWSDEDLRSRVFCDLMHMAFVCDLTRVSTLMLSYFQSFMSAKKLWNADFDFHSMTHDEPVTAYGSAKRSEIWNGITSWHAGEFAYLVDKLASTPEQGGTILDSTVLTMVFSGGAGAHGIHDYTMAIAGRKDFLKLGVHVETNAHPAHVMQTAMHAVGVEQDLGEVPGLIGDLML